MPFWRRTSVVLTKCAMGKFWGGLAIMLVGAILYRSGSTDIGAAAIGFGAAVAASQKLVATPANYKEEV